MTRGIGGHSPANVQKYLGGVDYPASKEDLLKQARQNDAPQEIIDTIQELQGDDYGGPQDVMKDYGKSH